MTNLDIGQIKDKLGLEKRQNYNIDSGEGRVPNYGRSYCGGI